MSPLLLAIIGLAFMALLFIIFGVMALRGRQRVGGSVQLLFGLLLLALGGLGTMAMVGMAGYRTLTREVLAATVEVERHRDQVYTAIFTFPDGEERSFTIAGDELYVDAHILKWHPAANLFGLHTGFELDRISGRYHSIDDEQLSPRTVFQLRPERNIDLYAIAERFPFLAPAIDAQYGSGTFVPLGDAASYEVLVSTSGLLIRASETR